MSRSPTFFAVAEKNWADNKTRLLEKRNNGEERGRGGGGGRTAPAHLIRGFEDQGGFDVAEEKPFL